MNAWAGGNHEISISSRVGYFSMNKGKYWHFLRSLINIAFYPVDGKHHCEKSAANEINNDGDIFHEAGVIDLIVLSCFVVISTPIIGSVLYLINIPNFIMGKR